MPGPLDTLLHHPAIWRATAADHRPGQVIATGFQELDRCLPGGGWPYPALIEVLAERWGQGEVSLLLPVLLHSAAVASERAIAWVNPPHLPYPVALAARGLDPDRQWLTGALAPHDALWAMEQSLRSAAFGAVLGWVERGEMAALRRLKLATDAGACMGVVFRAARARAQPSPATVRLAVSSDATGMQVELIKVQGGRPQQLRLPIVR